MKYLQSFTACVLAALLIFSGCTKARDNDNSNSSSKDDVSSFESVPITTSSESSSNESSSEESKDESESSSEENAEQTFNTDENIKTQQNDTSSEAKITYGNDNSDIPNISESISAPNINSGNTDYNSLSGEQIVWGPGSHTDENGRPLEPISLQDKYSHLGAYFIAPDNKNIYLTFDEGYENGFTSAILDTLKEKNVSAVFFITMDYATKNHDLIRRMIDEGHIVGNHSNHHPNMTTISDSDAADEIMSLHNYVLENFNYDMWLFRPPEGAFSERTLAVTHEQKYLSLFWSFAYRDWEVDNQPDNQTALNKMTSQLHGGAIYLLHAVSKTNTEVLGTFIDTAETQGYTFSKFDLPDPSVQ